MGYDGEESMYVSRAVLNAAYSDNGLALDFYKRSLVTNITSFILSRVRLCCCEHLGMHASVSSRLSI